MWPYAHVRVDILRPELLFVTQGQCAHLYEWTCMYLYESISWLHILWAGIVTETQKAQSIVATVCMDLHTLLLDKYVRTKRQPNEY